MGKKKKPSKAVQSKLIVPGSESQPKTQLLVPDSDVGKTTARLSVPGVEGQAEVPKPSLVVEEVPQEQAQAPLVAEEEGEQSTVISEDPVEAIVEEVAPVKVTAMVPPPPEPEMVEEIVEEFAAAPVEEVVEPVVAVAMSAPPELVEDPAVVAEEQPAGEAVVEPQAEFVEGV